MQTFENKHQFRDRIICSPEQKKEIERYLGVSGFNEYSFLLLIRRIKQLEQHIQELKYK